MANRPAMAMVDDLTRTSSLRYDSETFERTRTRVQYILITAPEKDLKFNRSKVDPVWKLVGQVHWPRNHGVNARQPEMPTQRRRLIDDSEGKQIHSGPFFIYQLLTTQIFKILELGGELQKQSVANEGATESELS